MYTPVEGITAASLDHHPLHSAHVHMIGIGGCGMSGLAALLLRIGARVSGSDLAPFDSMPLLVSGGARVSLGHRAANLPLGVDLVVASAAVPEDNAEFAAARSAGVRVIKYSQLLGELMEGLSGVAIAGTHGKSTTTAMCAFIFRESGLSPSFVVGARCDQLGGHSGVGSQQHFIVESCEYDRSFLHFRPQRSTILNIEADHLDCYRNLDEIVEAFSEFAALTRGDGLLVCNHDDSLAMMAAGSAACRVESFGWTNDAHWSANIIDVQQGCFAFDVRHRGEVVMSTRLAIPGKYNVMNALAAIALAADAGADLHRVSAALSEFRGVHRRMTLCGNGRGVVVVDDYAHHPTEIRVTIGAARERFTPERTVVVFQPHQYCRTRKLMVEFSESFSQADEVLVPDVYSVREGCDAQGREASMELVSRLQRQGVRASYLPTLDDVVEYVSKNFRAGDMILTMGAGDVWKVADDLVERICRCDGIRHSAAVDDVVSTRRSGSVSVPAA